MPPDSLMEMSIVRNLKRHLRGLLVAVAALSISASAVFAAAAHSGSGPADAAADGLKRADKAAGATAPTRPGQTVRDADDEGETIASETADDESANGAANGDRPMNHGWYVSRAAKATTPAGFDSHGAYVSSIAKGDDGKPESATKTGDRGVKGQARAAAAKAKAAQRQAAARP